jgi:hypothetical protein
MLILTTKNPKEYIHQGSKQHLFVFLYEKSLRTLWLKMDKKPAYLRCIEYSLRLTKPAGFALK